MSLQKINLCLFCLYSSKANFAGITDIKTYGQTELYRNSAPKNMIIIISKFAHV